MTSKQPRDMPASVRARLLNVAKLNNEAFDLVLVRFAIERLLYRLSQSQYRDSFVVKGAMMFQIWSNLSHRPTRDLDLLGTGEPDVDRFVEIFRHLCIQEVENDGLVFVADSVYREMMQGIENPCQSLHDKFGGGSQPDPNAAEYPSYEEPFESFAFYGRRVHGLA